MIEDSYPGPMPTDTSMFPEVMGNIGNKLLLRIFNPNYGWDLHYYNAP